MLGDTRYRTVEQTLPLLLPPITRAEARRAAAKLFAHFGGTKHGSAAMLRPARNRYGEKDGARRVWISPTPTAGSNHDKGWGRLIHDVSHDIFEQRCPQLRPHDNAHARLETEIAAYVVAQGWLDGTLLPKAKPKMSLAEKRQAALAKIDEATKRWRTKSKRAATALRKLARKRKALTRAMAAPHAIDTEHRAGGQRA